MTTKNVNIVRLGFIQYDGINDDYGWYEKIIMEDPHNGFRLIHIEIGESEKGNICHVPY